MYRLHRPAGTRIQSIAFIADTVSLFSDSSGVPGSSIFAFDNPDPITAPADNTFTAPANTTLMANTPYHIVVSAALKPNFQGTQALRLYRTSSNAEDSDGATNSDGTPDWAIADDGHFLQQLGGWGSGTYTMMIRVNGSSAGGGTPPLSTDATLSALSVTARLPLMTFVSGTTSYTTSVAPVRALRGERAHERLGRARLRRGRIDTDAGQRRVRYRAGYRFG